MKKPASAGFFVRAIQWPTQKPVGGWFARDSNLSFNIDVD
ncbi:hypothetical protein J2Y86_004403 [Pseudomonas migulae]|nr:hypothetical protein [Pseudomonas migulae]